MKHQFLAIFMTATAPTLTEEAGGGDPDGSGNYHPQGTAPNRTWNAGYVKATVKGTFPHGSLGPVFPSGPATVTLPDDWALLASLWAVDDNPYAGNEYGSAPMRWDIHDDTLVTDPDQHTSNACPIPGSTIDAVDNCLGNVGILRQRPTSGRSRGSTRRTGRPVVRLEVALPGDRPVRSAPPELDASCLTASSTPGDAPMPALRVDLDTTGTIGQLDEGGQERRVLARR